ncbi:lipocalin family protein [Moraxella bovis]|uniref:lipocalin family protein n=1 Tax=Moraxella bovis TaxID=476 RepID=UPI002227E6C0|nr:lipocalin family protein [Moraxella bovis]UYZ71626.1 lipocalin family protein [Moraxella bovis]UYZ72460.1 lipocalin family protein [Moraxella bovis]UZA14921.1 lipocalin family protein [Moraxella bovis]UZA38750.1 lipocalin family protein [Moraxella bovis]UZA42339.1 lipocalin family protein [Moraxella bovis]
MFYVKPAKSLLFSVIALSALSACTATPTNGTAPTTVSQIRLDDYLGRWYEIGRLPMSFQDKCTHNVTATYSLKDNGKINVLNACATKYGMTSVNGEAYATDETNTKLRVSFLPSFLKKLPIGKANYWVLASDQDTSGRYTSALVGTPNHKYLWVLSRTPTLDDATYERYLGIAKQNGYELSKFTKTPQK